MRVTNEQAIKIKALCRKVKPIDSCNGCRYNDNSYDYCPSSWYAPELADDLLEARELIKEMRKYFGIVRDNSLNPAHTITQLGLEETTDASHKIALMMIEKTKEYA